MNKKHVFALVLSALFIAGIISVTMATEAEAARQKRQCHTHYQKEYAYARWHCHTMAEMTTHGSQMVSSDRTSKINPDKALDSWTGSKTIMVADDYIGLTERANRRQLMDLFDFAFQHRIDPSRTRWCAAFVNGVLAKSGKKVTGSATAASFLKWGVRTNSPVMGDVVVLGLRGGGASHVGFYMGTTKIKGKTFVKVLGGNQRNSVKVAYYPANKVIQYRKAS